MEVALPQKLDALWSFVKAHLRVGPAVWLSLLVHGNSSLPVSWKFALCFQLSPFGDVCFRVQMQAKVIVFMSTCNQVRYAYEALRRLRPGVPLRVLHGKMKQMKRLAAFYDFCEVRLCCSDQEAVDD
jgi:superfamily II DNA/RNA helicase